MSDAGDMLRGGLDEVVFYTSAGDTLRVEDLGATAPPAEDVQYYPAGDGTKQVRTRAWEWMAHLVRSGHIATLQRWRDAGKEIGVIGLGPVALLWREPVPILLEEAGGRRGDFAGKRLRLYTGRLDAEVERSSDLLAGVAGEATSSGGARWRAALPLAGRLVRLAPRQSGTLTVRLFDAAGTLIVETQGAPSAGDDVYVELQEATHEIEIVDASGERPAVYLDPDDFVFVLLSEDAETAQVSLAGRGDATESTADLVNPLTGETVTVPTYRLEQNLLPQGRILADYGTYVTLQLDDE